MKQKSSRLKQGFGQVSNGVIRDPELTLQEKGIYAYLSTYANKSTDELFVSIDRMATECGVTRATIKRILKSLYNKGVIDRYFNGKGASKITVLKK